MHKFLSLLLIVGLCAAISPVAAQTAPYTDSAIIPGNSASVVWDAPAATYGPLLSLQTRALGSNTLKVDHLIKMPGGGVLTNAVEAAAANATLLVYPSDYTEPAVFYTNGVRLVSSPVKPVWLTPGDKLLFTSSATNVAGAAEIVIRAGFPGK